MIKKRLNVSRKNIFKVVNVCRKTNKHDEKKAWCFAKKYISSSLVSNQQEQSIHPWWFHKVKEIKKNQFDYSGFNAWFWKHTVQESNIFGNEQVNIEQTKTGILSMYLCHTRYKFTIKNEQQLGSCKLSLINNLDQ